MKFAGDLKFMLWAVVGVLALTLTGCGFFSNSHHDLALTQGNWSIAATSAVPANGTFYVGGNLTQSGSNLSGKLYIVDSLCFDPSQGIAFTGTVKGNQVMLTSASVEGQVLTVTATGSSGSALSGSYTRSGGGNCLDSDSGTAAANAVPSITGTWSGPISGSGGSNVTLSMALTQAATASADGTFALSGTLTYQNSSCASSGTITSGSLAGPSVGFNATTDTGDTIYYTYGLLDSATDPKHISNGTYSVVGTTMCDGDSDTPTFTKQ